MTANAILNYVLPCRKCGDTDRNAKGKCNTCNRARASAWYAANSDRARANGMAYRAANPEKHKAVVASYVAAHPGMRRAANIAWKNRNIERIKDQQAAWNASNHDAIIIHRNNRRARKLAVGGRLSKGLTKKLLELQKGKCACCGRPLGDNFHLDHRMPLALGGSNTDDNMQLLTATCNMQKGAKHPLDFMRLRGFLL